MIFEPYKTKCCNNQMGGLYLFHLYLVPFSFFFSMVVTSKDPRRNYFFLFHLLLLLHFSYGTTIKSNCFKVKDYLR